MYIAPRWSAPARIKAFSTTRLGGVSGQVYGSMNLGLHVGDDPLQVERNRQKLREDLNLPQEPIWLDQVHSNKVVNADHPIESSADGAFSKRSGTACIVMTADCLPLLLTNKAGDQVAAVHVGWRGMASGIIEKAVALFDCSPNDLIVWAGPCIGENKFSIGSDVQHQLGGPKGAYNHIENNGLCANLHLLCNQRLKDVGVVNFTYSAECTYSNEARFFSYRRDGRCGRMATLIWIDPAL